MRDIQSAAKELGLSATAVIAEAFSTFRTKPHDHFVGPKHDLWLFRESA